MTRVVLDDDLRGLLPVALSGAEVNSSGRCGHSLDDRFPEPDKKVNYIIELNAQVDRVAAE